jgi:hypothetical protein
MTVTHSIQAFRDTGANRRRLVDTDVRFPDGGFGRAYALVGVLEQQFDHEEFTDGSGAAGTVTFRGSIPKGAVVLGTKVTVEEGFAGDDSAALTIGDGSTADRYNTDTIDVFSTAADGVESGIPSGDLLLTAENQPVLTVTAGADWGSVTAGIVTVSIYFVQA